MLVLNAIHKLLRGSCLGQTSMATCPRMNFIKGSCPGVVVQGGISHEKMYGEQKLRGANSLGGILWVAIVQVETLGDTCPGGFYWGKLYGGSCPRGNIWIPLATFLKFFTFLFYFIKKNWKHNTKVQHVCWALTRCKFMLHFFLKDFNN